MKKNANYHSQNFHQLWIISWSFTMSEANLMQINESKESITEVFMDIGIDYNLCQSISDRLDACYNIDERL